MWMDHDETIRVELLTPLSATFYPEEENDLDEAEGDYKDEEYYGVLDGADLVQYQEAIQQMVDWENSLGGEDGEPCNLMQYFDGSPAITEKVTSAVVSVKEVDGVLYGCTTLQLKDFLDSKQMTELCEYITGQYSDGWGEGFEQREIPVDGGTLYVHFYQFENFYFQKSEAVQSHKELPSKNSCPVRPKMKLLGHDGNIYSILGDARRLLTRYGQSAEAEEMMERVEHSGNYYKALHIISEYVETELSVPKLEQPEKKERPSKTGKEGDCR